MNAPTFSLGHRDMLAHANLASTLGHGLPPWCTLDDDLRGLALQLVELDPTLPDGLKLATDEPELFATWLKRERVGLRSKFGPLATPRRRPARIAKKLDARHGLRRAGLREVSR